MAYFRVEMESPAHILKTYWNYDRFRPLQEEIIGSVLEDRDTLAVLPTGGGKSICFQVPALARDGLCLVVSPLIALMKDQVDQLKKRNIPALMIHSGMKRQDVVRTLENARSQYFKFLYLAPERLETSLFLEYLPALHVNMIAVDEAHCISQWGYDFRPSYLRIAAIREELPGVPVLALTASATPEVQDDICRQLHFHNGNRFAQSFERPNLSYSVFQPGVKMKKIEEILGKVPGSAIIYASSRRRTESIATHLSMKGFQASFYHAGLGHEERSLRQKEWIEGKTRVMACTNAFGMGIDKPDVRLVIHADLPECPESYYQEAGRAGRDGKKSFAVLLASAADLEGLSNAHLEKFPSVQEIREVYQDLHNFLQVPSSSGEGQSFAFDFEKFTRNYKRPAARTLNAMKALEQDGWFDFNEKSFSPSTLVFRTNKRELYSFQEAHPEHEPLLTLLLRTYEGIFDFPSFISEKNLAHLIRSTEETIANQLRTIASFGIISYTPRSDAPQLILRRNRVSADALLFREAPYLERKKAYQRRVASMIGYVNEQQCRSQYLGTYFGDPDAKTCGSCDLCLERNRDSDTEEALRVRSWIEEKIKAGKIQPSVMLEALGSVRKETFWKVVDQLQAENYLVSDEEGNLYRKNR